MAITTINFSHSKPLSVKTEGLADLELFGRSGSSMAFLNTLVDTGADYVMFPQSAGIRVGIQMKPSHRVNMKTAGASTTMFLVPNVHIHIEGKCVQIDVLFNPRPGSRSLLGRNGIRALGEVGFDLNDWLWRL
jgi:predicted aspartyl protease